MLMGIVHMAPAQIIVDTTNMMVDTTHAEVFVPDTAKFKTKFRKGFSLKWHMQPHSTLKATLLAAALPGAGQLYNHKYWKAPIVYAGLGTCIGFIVFNTRQYNFYKREYIATADDDASTVPTVYASASQLDKVQDQYHRWMDVSYICLAGVYILQVIDANVDAHLFYFDIGKELSLNFHPSFINTGQVNPALGITLGF